MRKNLYNHIASMLKTLKKVNQKIVYSTNIPDLFMQCQECAIAMGNSIEEAEGEDSECVTLLEEYCELIYQLSIADSNTEWSIIVKSLKMKLEQFELNLRQLKVTAEVVFMPYKASMWDALESIWISAKEDKNYLTYVIPIPYYDKNPDGTLGAEHYEGDQFPEYVPITSYKEYSVETEKPDIIFIHNPYDDCNFVTTIHPYFYAKELKKYTEKLVYVPYYILNGESVPKDFVFLPGVFHSDYIIVQNEKEKDDYIRHFKNEYPEYNIADKLLPLGSPKIDKLKVSIKVKKEIPEKWTNKIMNKKILFYNTSINGLLSGNERYLNKIKNTFMYFKNIDHVILLWRPHPLMESTIQAMRPELYNQYHELTQKFITEDLGIYDDTPEMYTAIGISDAYYGDWSSLVYLFQAAGKTIMIQNSYMTNEWEGDITVE